MIFGFHLRIFFAFEIVGLNWKKYVKTHKRFFRPYEVDYLRGDNSKAKKILKWKPKIIFEKLVKLMVEEDLRRWNSFLDGNIFPWDAPLYPDENKFLTNAKKRNILLKK